MRKVRQLGKSKLTRYLPILIILLSLTVMVGSTFAYFSDKDSGSGNLTFSKVELSESTEVGMEATLYDILPGSKIIDNTIQFSKSLDSEPIYVRAKVSFSLKEDLDEETKQKMTPYLRALQYAKDFEIFEDEQHGAIWSEKEANYFYLLNSEKTSLKVVDTIDTYILAHSITVPRSVEQLEGYAQYLNSINFHMAFQAIQADNVEGDLPTLMALFDSVFPESKAEEYVYPDLMLNLYNESLTAINTRVLLTREDVTVVPSNPESSDPNKVFMGWYTDKAFTTRYAFGATIKEAVDLYPRFETATNPADFIFDGNTLVKYGGEDTNVVIPRFYSMSDTPITRTVYITNEYQFLDYVGSAGVPYPITVTYGNGKGSERIQSGFKPSFYPCTFEIDSYFTYAKGDGNDIAVTAIGENGLYSVTHITSLTLHDNITSISASAMRNVTGITYLELPESILTIGAGAFGNNNKLREVYNRSRVNVSGLYVSAVVIKTTVNSNLYLYDDGNVEWVFYKDDNGFVLAGYNSYDSLNVTTPPSGIEVRKMFANKGEDQNEIVDEYSLASTFEYSPLESVTLSDAVTSSDGYEFSNYLGYMIDATNLDFMLSLSNCNNLEYFLCLSEELAPTTISEDIVYVVQSGVEDALAGVEFQEVSYGDLVFGEAVYNGYYYIRIGNANARAISYIYLRSLNQFPQQLTGSGSEADPYVISNIYQWKDFASKVNSGNTFNNKYIVVTKDITFNNTATWETWSNSVAPNNALTDFMVNGTFYGKLNGQGNTLQGIYINSTNSNVALINNLQSNNSAYIKNLNIEKSYIYGPSNVAGLVAYNYGTITNCRIDGMIAGANVSGITINNYNTITNCEVNASLNGTNTASGIAYYNSSQINYSIFDGIMYAPTVYGICQGTSTITGSVAIINAGDNVKNIYPLAPLDARVTDSYSLINVEYNNISRYTIYGSYDAYALVKNANTNEKGLPYSVVSSIGISMSLSSTYNYHRYAKVAGADGDVYYKSLANFLYGSGSEEDPYTISNLVEWNIFANLVNNRTSYRTYFVGEYVSLTGDIVVNNTDNFDSWDINTTGLNSFTMAGTNSSTAFAGIFNGNGYKISGIYLNSNYQYVGVFGMLSSGAEINNLTIENAFIASNHTNYSDAYVGGLAGYNSGAINNCIFQGKTIGSQTSIKVGGLVGYNYGTITNGVTINNMSSEENFALVVYNTTNGKVVNSFAITNEDYDSAVTKGYNGASNAYAVIAEVDETVSGTEFSEVIISDRVFGLSSAIDGYRYVKVTQNQTVTYYKALRATLSGSGSEDDPYTISNVNEWNTFAGMVNDGVTFAGEYVALASDITFNDVTDFGSWSAENAPSELVEFNYVGNDRFGFAGTFDGQNNSLIGIYNINSNYNTIFTRLNTGAVLTGLTVTNSYFGGTEYVAGFVGINYGTITNCAFTGKIITTATNNVGTIVSYNYGTIKENTFIGTYQNGSTSTYAVGGNNSSIVDTYVLIDDTQTNLRNKNFRDSSYVYYPTTNITTAMRNANYKTYNFGDVEIKFATIVGVNYVKYGETYYRAVNASLEQEFVPTSTIIITNVDEWNAFVARVNNGENLSGIQVELANNIVFNDTSNHASWSSTYSPSGLVTFNNMTRDFAGVFDGKGFALEGIYVSTTSNYAIFNNLTSSGVIKNLAINKSYIYSTNRVVGLVHSNSGSIDSFTMNYRIESNSSNAIGITYTNNGTILNCTISGTITSNNGSSVMGVVYENYSGYIDSTYVTATLSTTSTVYGIAYNSSRTISNTLVEINYNNSTNIYPLVYNMNANLYSNTYAITTLDYDTALTKNFKNADKMYARVTATSEIEGLTYSELMIGGKNVKISNIHNSYRYFAIQNGASYNYYKSIEMQMNGLGSEDNPYTISSVNDWNIFASKVNGGNNFVGQYVALANNIAFNDTTNFDNWDSDTRPTNDFAIITGTFSGTFDGKNYVLSGIYINQTNSNLAVFYQNSGTIKNLSIIESYVYSDSYVAGFIYYNNGTVDNCNIHMNVEGNYAAGFAYSSNRTIEDSKFEGNVKGNTCAVGLVYSLQGCTIRNCEVSGKIEAVNYAAGLAYNCDYNNNYIYSSFVDAFINANSIAGLVYNQRGTIQDSLSNITFGQEAATIYPTVNTMSGTFTNCYGILDMDYAEALDRITNMGDVFVSIDSVEDSVKALKYTSTTIAGLNVEISQRYNSSQYVRISTGATYKYYKALLVELDGTGTQNDPYVISTVEDWIAFASKVNNGNTFMGEFVALGNDITFNDTTNWESWNRYTTPENMVAFTRIMGTFAGTFNGKDYALKGIYLSGTGNISIFTQLNSYATVKNLTIDSSYIYSSNGYATGLTHVNYGTIQNCLINANIEAINYSAVGIAYQNEGKILDVGVTGDLTSTVSAMGIVYTTNSNSQLQNCLVQGKLNAIKIYGIAYQLYGKMIDGLVNIYIGDKVDNVYPLYEQSNTSAVIENCYVLVEVDFKDIFDYNFSSVDYVYASNEVEEEVKLVTYNAKNIYGVTVELSEENMSYDYIRVDRGEYAYYQSLVVELQGEGSESDPILITSVADYQAFASKVNSGETFAGKHLAITKDIVFNDTTDLASWSSDNAPVDLVEFTRITGTFAGILDGRGFALKGIYISQVDNVVLIQQLQNGGTIKNLSIIDSYIYSYGYAGFMYYNSGTLDNVTISMNIESGNSYAFGGVYNNNSSNSVIRNSSFNNNIKAYSTIYGITNENYGIIDTCVVQSTFNTTSTIYMMVNYNRKQVVNNFAIVDMPTNNGNTMYPYNGGNNYSGSIEDNNYLLLNMDYETAKTRGFYVLNNVYALSEVSSAVKGLEYTNKTINNLTIALSSVYESYNYYRLQTKYYKSMVLQAKNAGTEEDPHVISTVEDWNTFVTRINSGIDYSGQYIELGNDIVFNDVSTYDTWSSSVAPENLVTFNRITKQFAGYFDGKNFALKGIYYKNNSFNIFYNLVNDAYIKNLKVENVFAYTTSSYTMSGIAYSLTSTNVIENCSFSGNITSYGSVSGIAYDNGGIIRNCTVDGTLTCTDTSNYYNYGAFGITYSNYGEISNCVINAMLDGAKAAGVTYSFNTGYSLSAIKNCVINFTIGSRVNNIYPYSSSTSNTKVTDSYTLIQSDYNTVLGKSISNIENVYAYVSEVSDEVKAIEYSEVEVNGTTIGLSDSYRSFKYAYISDGEVKTYYKSLDMELEGTGTEDDPHVISSVEEWRGFATQVNGGDTFSGKYIELGADIEFNDVADYETWSNTVAPENLVEFTRITSGFAGTFDGKGFTLSGIYIYSTNSYVQLFYSLSSGATIKNLNIDKSYIGGSQYVSGLVYSNSGTIDNVNINATIQCSYTNSSYSANGIVYENSYGGVIKNSKVSGHIKSNYYVNGICYYNRNIIDNCVVDAKFSGYYVGGFVYQLNNNITNCIAIVDVQYTSISYIGMTAYSSSTSYKFANCYMMLKNEHSSVVNYSYRDRNNIFASVADTTGIEDLTYNDIEVGTSTFGLTDTTNHYRYIKLTNGEDVTYYQTVETLLNGSGTEDDPYTISSVEEWNIFATLSNRTGYTSYRFDGQYISLTADIEVNDTTDFDNWSNSVTPQNIKYLEYVATNYTFAGIFNGNNHIISGIYRSTSSNYLLFRQIATQAEINNLIIEKSYFRSTNTGSVLVYNNAGTVRNCIVNAKLDTNYGTNTTNYMSGIAYQNTGNIINCVVIDYSNDPAKNIYPVSQISSGKITNTLVVLNESYDDAVEKEYLNKALTYAYVAGSISGDFTTFTIGDKTIGYTEAPISGNKYVYITENGTTKYYKSLSIFMDGAGSEEEPYVISSVEDWNKFALQVQGGNDFTGKYVELGADIVVNDTTNFASWSISNAPESLVNFEMAGYNTLGFGGTFNGKGYSISGIYLTSDSQYTGVFACLNTGAVIKNLSIEKSFVISTRKAGYTAGLVGYNRGGTIESSVYEGGVYGEDITSYIYGLAYSEGNSTFKNSLFIITHSLNNTTSLLNSGSVNNCYTITNEEFVSALGVGFNDRDRTYAHLSEVGSEVTGATTFISTTIGKVTIATATIDNVRYIKYNGKYYRDLYNKLTLTGNGTAANPYKITSVLDWNIFANMSFYYYNSYYFELTTDLEFNDTTNWETWSYENRPENLVRAARKIDSFRGYFDGKGHTISGVYMVANNSNGGLFRYIYSSSRIADLNIEKSFFYFAASQNGALAGYTENSTITNVHVNANIMAKSTGSNISSGTNGVGGLIGYTGSSSTTITNCSFTGSIVNYAAHTAGIISRTGNYSSSLSNNVSNCSVDADITGAAYIYGVAYANVTNCTYEGDITLLDISSDYKYVYGLAYGTVTDSSFEGNINAEIVTNSIQIIIYGLSYTTVKNSTFTGDINIKNNSNITICGMNANSNVNDCTFTGDIVAESINSSISIYGITTYAATNTDFNGNITGKTNNGSINIYGISGSGATNCEFNGNITSESLNSNANVYGIGANTATDCTFTGNIVAKAPKYQISVYGISNSNTTNCHFIGNITTECASQFYVYGISSSNVSNSTFTGDINVNVGLYNGSYYGSNNRIVCGIAGGSATNSVFTGDIKVVSTDTSTSSYARIYVYGIAYNNVTDCVFVGSMSLEYTTNTHYIYPLNNNYTKTNSYVLVTDTTNFMSTDYTYVLEETVDATVSGLSFSAITLNSTASEVFATVTDDGGNVWIRVKGEGDTYTYYKKYVAA